MDYHAELLRRLTERSARVAVIGAGYVGLPLALEFARAGFRVVALDVDEGKIARLNRAESYIDDISNADLAPLVASGHLRGTIDYADLADADTISICVPTPLTHLKEPDVSYIEQAMQAIATIAHPGILVVLESTSYPGTTEELIVPPLQASGLTIGKEAFVAFSPERIDPGNPTYGVHNTPKIIGGITPACSQAAIALYGSIAQQVVPVSSPAAAEMSKLLENTFRMVNIALINEMALMATKLNVDIWEVIQAASTKPFGFMPFYPGPGLGGHCIPIDPHYLGWRMKHYGYRARFIDLAEAINSAMPQHVVGRIMDALNDEGKALRGARIVVLGAAYKPNISDMRESPALEILQHLRAKGAEAVYHDPHVPSLRLEDGTTLTSAAFSEALLHEADCVVVVTHHKAYDWEQVRRASRLIVDTRHVIPRTDAPGARIISL